MINPATDRVLITGAAGAIGTALRNGLRSDWRQLRLTDIRPDRRSRHRTRRCIVADIGDRAGDRAHDAAASRPSCISPASVGDYTLEDLFRVNARGLFDVFEAARLAGVERIVFAIQQPRLRLLSDHRKVSPALPPRPDSLYGTFKAWGETMLRGYFDRHGIRSVSLRIGTYRTLPIDQRSLATWLSARRRRAAGRRVAAPSRSRLPGGERLFQQHAHQDPRSQLGDPGLSPEGQCRGPSRDAARHGRRSCDRARGNGPNMAARTRARRNANRAADVGRRGALPATWRDHEKSTKGCRHERQDQGSGERVCAAAAMLLAATLGAQAQKLVSPARSPGTDRCRSWSPSTRGISRNRDWT